MAPVARMLTARTAASASQLARARPVTASQPDGGSRSEPSRSAHARMIWRGSVPVGHENELVYCDMLGLSTAELADLHERGVV